MEIHDARKIANDFIWNGRNTGKPSRNFRRLRKNIDRSFMRDFGWEAARTKLTEAIISGVPESEWLSIAIAAVNQEIENFRKWKKTGEY